MHLEHMTKKLPLEDPALIGGGHGIGRCHKDRSGFEGLWTNFPVSIINAYFKELFNQEWKVR